MNVSFACSGCDHLINDADVVLLNGAAYHRGECAEERLREALAEATIPAQRTAEDEGGYTFVDLFDNVRTPAQEQAAEAVINAARVATFGLCAIQTPELRALADAVRYLDSLGACDEVRP